MTRLYRVQIGHRQTTSVTVKHVKQQRSVRSDTSNRMLSIVCKRILEL